MPGNYSRVKVWSSGEILTAADLNAEFNNEINNAIPSSIDAPQVEAQFLGYGRR